MNIPKITSVKIEKDEGSSVIAGATYVNLIVKVAEEIINNYLYFNGQKVITNNGQYILMKDKEKSIINDRENLLNEMIDAYKQSIEN